jgi:hypothetical protein
LGQQWYDAKSLVANSEGLVACVEDADEDFALDEHPATFVALGQQAWPLAPKEVPFCLDRTILGKVP